MAEAVAVDRPLPHNLEAERSVLGAILIHNEAFNSAAEVVNPRDFYRDAHRRIFEKMVQLSERGDAIDFITLKEELSRSGELDEVGGPAYIAALVDGLPHATNIEYYARIVREKSTLRNLIFSANKILANAYEAEQEPNQILDEAEQSIFAIAEDRVRAGFVSMRTLAHASFETIERAHERKQLITGVPSGFADLDELTAGFQPGDLVIVAARPSVGKTALALNVAQHVGTRTGRTVGIFSLEMSKEQLFLRMLTSEARIDSHRLRTGFLVESDWGRLSHALGTLSEAKIYIDDTPGIGALEMRAKSRRLAAEHGLDLLVIDYIQLMQGRGRFENRTLELASISRSLKGLAKELNVPVLVISQLSRAPEARSDHRPLLSDLRECVAGDTLVMLRDGRRVPVRDLVGTEPAVWSVTSEGRLQPARAERVWSVGKRQIQRVRLASGRSIRVTGEHRLLAGGAWKRVIDLRAGDRLAIARRLPEGVGSQAWPELRVALLGHLIGDGSYLAHQPLRYTTASAENSAVVARAATGEFDCRVTRHEGPTGTWHQLVIAGNGNRWHPAGVNAWLKELGIFGQRSFQKRIPALAFRLPNEQIALLLRHLWATDGCVARRAGRGGPSVYYATTSEGLAFDVAALLLRFGIVARIGTATKEGCRRGFHVRVSGAEDQRLFLAAVGAYGPRVQPATALAAELDGITANTNVDTLPPAVFARVRELMAEQGISQRRMAVMRGTAYGGASHFQFAPSRTVALEYAELLDAPDIRSAATSDLFWDRIVSIEPAGEEEVYDLTVPGPACWLADGVVSHNSGALEQDADVVVLLFRPDQYPDVKPEDENIAELNVAKQRNGPTGLVRLAFLKQETRFGNLEQRQ
ncbi:MAG TPA: replicative DNA helicase [Vicinamibacterales bacterium]|jgi:replicative DNA helicase|nr:replicative DNA helicase [Vicinamibacterales bacterium]